MSDSMTGGVNASIPLQAGRQTTANPLQSIGDAANMIGTIDRLRLMRGMMQPAPVQTDGWDAHRDVMSRLLAPEGAAAPSFTWPTWLQNWPSAGPPAQQ